MLKSVREEGEKPLGRCPHSVRTAIRSFCFSPVHKENPAPHSVQDPLESWFPCLSALCVFQVSNAWEWPQTQKGFTSKPVVDQKCVQAGRKRAVQGRQGCSRAGSVFGSVLTRESDGPAHHRHIMI